ncbi:MAG: hypothetical protein QME61_00590 [Patescibacteria group bacterium]|nr:hypothetical protein [Patescibacteria group bacterium]
MKLPITDQFLWDLYNLIEGIKDLQPTLSIQPITMKKAVCPDLYELRRIYEKKQRRKDFSKLVSYLKKKGWIKIKELQEKKALILTPKGKEKILKVRNKLLLSLPRNKRKDGKWIMVAFDIPEKKKIIRNYFREKLIELGFQNFQKSIWTSPFDVLKEIQEIIQNLGIEKNVKIFLIEETEI